MPSSEDKALRAQANLRELDNVRSFKGQSYNKERVVIGLSGMHNSEEIKKSDREKKFIKAAELGDIDEIKSMIAKGKCDINCMVSNLSALITAAANGFHDVVKFLLEKKCDINLHNKNGINALIAASGGGHVSVVTLLIRRNCHLNAQSFDGNTALMDACNKGHLSVADTLIKAGCNTKLVNKKSNNAMDILNRKHPSLVVKFKELLDCWTSIVISPEVVDESSKKQKYGGVIRPYSDEPRKKQKMGGDIRPYSDEPRKKQKMGGDIRPYSDEPSNKCVINPRSSDDHDDYSKNSSKNKPQSVKAVPRGSDYASKEEEYFIKATESGDFNKVQSYLKANSVLINCRDRDGMTALAWASMKGHKDIVELLLSCKHCDLDTTDRFGTTALILACCSGHVDIATKLINSACDHTIKDAKGKGALDYLSCLHPAKCTAYLEAVRHP